jgi:NAD-dependent deacetylase sirtuin 5
MAFCDRVLSGAYFQSKPYKTATFTNCIMICRFTESLPSEVVERLFTWITDPPGSSKTIDMMLVIGTSALVYPATSYIEAARRQGARVVVVDIEKEDPSLLALEEQDWYFQGDAALLVPEMLRPITGSLD